jgi:hypothetical protein
MYWADIDNMPDYDDYDCAAAAEPSRTKCSRCGVPIGFTHTGKRWLVYEIGTYERHTCGEAKPDEFEDMT